MAVHLNIALHLYIKVKEPVAREPVQHMIKKRDSCINLITALSVEIDRKADICFLCLSYTASDPLFHPSYLLFVFSVKTHFDRIRVGSQMLCLCKLLDICVDLLQSIPRIGYDA